MRHCGREKKVQPNWLLFRCFVSSGWLGPARRSSGFASPPHLASLGFVRRMRQRCERQAKQASERLSERAFHEGVALGIAVRCLGLVRSGFDWLCSRALLKQGEKSAKGIGFTLLMKQTPSYLSPYNVTQCIA